MFEIRENLGITQEDLADYLNQSRALISLVILKRRELPIKSIEKIAKLETANAEVTDAELQPTPEENQFLFEVMQKHVSECEFEVQALERKLLKLEKSILQARRKLATMTHLKASLPPTDKHALKWIDLQEAIATEYLSKERLIEAQKMKLKLELLKLEVERAREFVI